MRVARASAAARVAIGVLMLGSARAEAQEPPSAAQLKEAERELAQMRTQKPAEYQQTVRALQHSLCILGFYEGPTTGEEDERTKSAVAGFAAQQGLTPTQHPSAELLIRAFDRSRQLVGPSIILPGLEFRATRDTVYARGTWVGREQPISGQLHVSELRCDRQSGTCIYVKASLGQSDGDLFLDPILEMHEVERWDEHELVTKPKDALCARWVYRVSFRDKRVTGTRTRIGKPDDRTCQNISEGDWTLDLTGGEEVSAAYAAHRKRDVAEALGRNCPLPERTSKH